MASGEWLRTSSDGIKRDVLRLTAWMPNGFASYEFDEDVGGDLDDFEDSICKDCSYYFNTFDDYDCDDITDGNDNPAISITYRSLCPCRRDGIGNVDFPCKAGHDEPETMSYDDRYGDLPPMAFAIDLHPKFGFSQSISAWMQKIDPEQRLIGDKWQSINCFDTDAVCWGDNNDKPGSLPEAVTTYGDALCNDDLLKPGEFFKNITTVIQQPVRHPLKAAAIGAGFDAAVLVHAAQHPAAYLLLRGSGHDSEGGVIIAGVHRHHHDGIDGFITAADSNGRCWFITYAKEMPDADNNLQAVLLGQIPHPLATHSCSSPAPSSSELVAVAAS